MTRTTKSPPKAAPVYPEELATDDSGQAGLTFCGFVTDGRLDNWGERIVAALMTCIRLSEAIYAFRQMPDVDDVLVTMTGNSLKEVDEFFREMLHSHIITIDQKRQEQAGGVK